MKKLLIVLLTFMLLSIGVAAAVPVNPVSDEGAVLVYQNTFDDASAISDFTQYRGTWSVVDGTLRLTDYSSNTNSFIIYNGDSDITSLADYIVEVDMLNSQGATGLVARADLDSVCDQNHGHCGYLSMVGTNGYIAGIRKSSADGKSTSIMNTSKQLLHHGTDIHIRIAVRGNLITTTLTDIDSGMELWGWTQIDDSWSKGSVGLFAYTKIVDGLDNRNVSFDNLKIYTLPALSEKNDFTAACGGMLQYGTVRLDSTEADTVAIYNTSQAIGTVKADVFTPASGKVGLVFAKDQNSYYKLAYSSDKYLYLIKVVDGYETVLKKTQYLHGTSWWGIGDIRAVYDGETVYGYFLDKCLIKYTDSSPLTGTGIGVFSDAAGNTIMNFEVSDTTTPDKADIIIWGHSHMGRWLHAYDVLGDYGKVMNLGIGGSTTAFWYSIADELATYEADTVIIMSGSNDLALRENTETLKYLSDTIGIMKKSNPDLEVILITEWYQPGRYEAYAAKVRDMNRLWAEYAEKNSKWITLVDGFGIAMNDDGTFNGFLSDGTTVNSEVFADSQHLSILSYDKLNARVLEALEYRYNGGTGDADGDGTITVRDVIVSLEMLVNRDFSKMFYLDVSGDGKFTILDVIIIMKNAVK